MFLEKEEQFDFIAVSIYTICCLTKNISMIIFQWHKRISSVSYLTVHYTDRKHWLKMPLWLVKDYCDRIQLPAISSGKTIHILCTNINYSSLPGLENKVTIFQVLSTQRNGESGKHFYNGAKIILWLSSQLSGEATW